MTRCGSPLGSDVRFLGVARCGIHEPFTLADSEIPVLRARFEGSRPSPAWCTDALRALTVLDASAHVPGAGTPESGGLTARELLEAVPRVAPEPPVHRRRVGPARPAPDGRRRES